MNQPRNQREAEATVFDNLGLSREDLGIDRDEDDVVDRQDVDDSADDDRVDDRDADDNDAREQDDDFERESHTEQRSVRRDVREQQERQQRQPRPLPKKAEVKADRNGNLINAKGEVVARAGREARHYQNWQRAQSRITNMETQYAQASERFQRLGTLAQQLADENDRYRAQEAEITKLGLAPAERLQALAFAAEAKRDPKAAVKKMLTLAATNGINLAELGEGAQGGLDPKSLLDIIRTEIQNATNPLKEDNERRQQQTQQEQEQQQRQEAALSHVQQFFGQNPEAVPYEPLFRQLLQHPVTRKMSLGEMWARIQLNLERNSRRERTPQNRQRGAPRMPAGRGSVGPVGEDRVRTDLAPVGSSYGDIIREVMRSAS